MFLCLLLFLGYFSSLHEFSGLASSLRKQKPAAQNFSRIIYNSLLPHPSILFCTMDEVPPPSEVNPEVNPAQACHLLSPKGPCATNYLLLNPQFSSRPDLPVFKLFRSLPFPPVITTACLSLPHPCQMSPKSWSNQLIPPLYLQLTLLEPLECGLSFPPPENCSPTRHQNFSSGLPTDTFQSSSSLVSLQRLTQMAPP